MSNPINLLTNAVKYRGSIINDVAWLERLIDNYIIYHFTRDEVRVIEMQLLIFGDNRIAFENKRQIFDYIATKHDYDWYISYIPLRKKDYKKTIPANNDLVWVIEERNKFAHLILDTTEHGLSDTGRIALIRYKNSTERHYYNDDDFKELLLTITALSNFVAQRIKEK